MNETDRVEMNEDAWESISRTFVDRALTAYEECADWTECERLGDDAEASGNYVIGFHVETLATFSADVTSFIRDNAADVAELSPESIGHDLWLTRNRHGAGFWDGDYAPEIGKRLTDAAHAYGTCDLYVGDDGWVYAA